MKAHLLNDLYAVFVDLIPWCLNIFMQFKPHKSPSMSVLSIKALLVWLVWATTQTFYLQWDVWL